jgi:hypothetical protein
MPVSLYSGYWTWVIYFMTRHLHLFCYGLRTSVTYHPPAVFYFVNWSWVIYDMVHYFSFILVINLNDFWYDTLFCTPSVAITNTCLVIGPESFMLKHSILHFLWVLNKFRHTNVHLFWSLNLSDLRYYLPLLIISGSLNLSQISYLCELKKYIY